MPARHRQLPFLRHAHPPSCLSLKGVESRHEPYTQIKLQLHPFRPLGPNKSPVSLSFPSSNTGVQPQALKGHGEDYTALCDHAQDSMLLASSRVRP